MKYFTCLILIFLVSCKSQYVSLSINHSQETDEGDPVSEDNPTSDGISAPEMTIICQEIDGSYCNAGMDGHSILVTLVNSDSIQVAGFIGVVECGDSGGAVGVNCSLRINSSDWGDVNSRDFVDPLGDIEPGEYDVTIRISVADGSYTDPPNFPSTDQIICSNNEPFTLDEDEEVVGVFSDYFCSYQA